MIKYLRAQCPCGARLRIKHEAVGKRLKCPKCRIALRVPKPTRKKGPHDGLGAVASDRPSSPDDTIEVLCTCGNVFPVNANLSGNVAICPHCQESCPLTEPRPDTRSGLEDDDPVWEEMAPKVVFQTATDKVARFRKHASGEILRYRPGDLSKYAGKQICLRITLSALDLDSCFFVYINEHWEQRSISVLLERYFDVPSDAGIEEMKATLRQWTHVDPQLLKKYVLLRQMFATVRDGRATVTYHINNGPSDFSLHDPISQHLGTSVWTNGQYDDKILDLVLEFHSIAGAELPEVFRWMRFGPMHVAAGGSAANRERSSNSKGMDRRSANETIGLFAFLGLIAVLFLSKGCLIDSDGEDDFYGGGL